MKKFIAALLVLITAFTLTACTVENKHVNEEDKPLRLVENGQSNYKIVVSQSEPSSEVYAAKELQKYIAQISGKTLDIISDQQAPSGNEIIVGNTVRKTFPTDLVSDGFILQTVGNNVYITGQNRGVIYGVYEFLEKYLDCGFYAEDCEEIPKNTSIAISQINENRQEPVFDYRDCYWKDYGNYDIRLKQKLNVGFSQTIPENLGGQPKYIGRCHTLGLLSTGHHSYEKQPCLSDETIYQTVLKNALDWIKSNPTANIISISQDDGAKFCTCEKCTATNEKYGGTPSGSLMVFVNRIAEDISKIYPNIKIHTFAYQDTRTPPVGIVPEDNVIVELCSIEFCFSHPLETCLAERSTTVMKFSTAIKEWAKICKNLYVGDYTTDFSNYLAPFPNFNVIRQNARFFAENNVKGLFEQGTYDTLSGEFAELRSYLLSKLLWDPYMTEEDYNTYMCKFLQAYYGAGWRNILSYINLMIKTTEDSHIFIYDNVLKIYPCEDVRYDRNNKPQIPDEAYADVENHDWLQYSKKLRHFENSFIEAAEIYWQAAFELCDSDEAKAHLEKLSIQLLACKSAFLGFVKDQGLPWTELQFFIKDKRLEIIDETKKQLDAVIYENNKKLYDLLIKYNITKICEWTALPSNPNLYNEVTAWNQ